MSKIGAHVTSHPRTNYETFCRAKPAVVLSLNDGGALMEVKNWTAGHTWTIFRDTTVYLEAPGDINNPPGTYEQMASYWYPKLKAKWDLNKADFYTITNEQGGGGDDLQAYRNLVAYEREIMKLANADGIKVCVLNLAGGSPDPMTVWVDECVPFLQEAFANENIYGRHAYQGNWDRPLEEAQWLLNNGLGHGGLAITEWGFSSGYGQTHDVQKIKVWDEVTWEYPNIIGFCIWELGKSEFNANWDNKIPYIAPWMEVNPTDKWQPGDPEPDETLEEHIWRVSLDAQTISLNKDAALQKRIYAIGYVPVGTETNTAYDGKQYVLQPAEELTGRPRLVAVAEVPNWETVWFVNKPDDPPPPPFKLTNWPAVSKEINQRWGARPEYYKQFGLPGHDGVDVAALLNDAIKAAAAGEIYRVHIENRDGEHNYGNHVRIQHQDGFKSIYAHLNDIPADINAGTVVKGGQLIGYAGSTGNSTGVHLHFGMKRPPGDIGWPYDLINPEPYLFELLPEPPTDKIDLAGYVIGDGRRYYLKNHDGSTQELLQCQVDSGRWYQVKNQNWESFVIDEQWIRRDTDTSPGGGRYYTQREGNEPARWLPKRMAIGEQFTVSLRVQFYNLDTCSPSAPNSGDVTDTRKLVARHQPWTSRHGIQLPDVIEVLWTNGGETYYYGKNYGLVGWERLHQDPNSPQWTAISELVSGGNNSKMTGCFS